MALVDVDSWLTEYEACERLNHTLLSQLAQRDKRQNFSQEYNRLTASIQVGLKQFDTELGQLKEKLNVNARSKTITFEEIERRQRQVETLQSQLQQLQRKFTKNTRSDRAALLQQPSSSTGSPWEATDSAAAAGGEPPIIDTNDVDALKRHQAKVLENQERGLNVLSQSLSRQRDLARQLHTEVDDQNDILDNLANTMERVDARVNVETGNITQVNRRDSTWSYWIVIVLLFIAIIVVGVL